MNRPLITVVTAVHNDAANIGATMDSVLGQTYSRIEYIVIDGGSTDGTVDVIRERSDRLTYWTSEPDGGIYDAMNKGIAAASGEWINFMNSGDRFHGAQTVAQLFGRGGPNADFVYGGHVWRAPACECIVPPRPLELMWQRTSFSHQTLFARTALMKARPFSMRYRIVSDYEFYFSHYVRGHRFHNSGAVVAVVSPGGVSDRGLWLRTRERWHVARTHRPGPGTDLFYLAFTIRNVIGPLAKRTALRAVRPLLAAFGGMRSAFSHG